MYVGYSTKEKMGRRGALCLRILLGKPDNLGARPSEFFNVNSSFFEIFFFCFNLDTNVLTLSFLARVVSQFNG